MRPVPKNQIEFLSALANALHTQAVVSGKQLLTLSNSKLASQNAEGFRKPFKITCERGGRETEGGGIEARLCRLTVNVGETVSVVGEGSPV